MPAKSSERSEGERGIATQAEYVMQDDFPEKLKAGFLSEYDRLKAIGYSGDSLFFCLFDFAGGKHSEHIKRAAGLAVLAYLFQICEVFEK